MSEEGGPGNQFQLAIAEVSYSVILSEDKFMLSENDLCSNQHLIELFHTCVKHLSLPVDYTTAKQCFCWGVVSKGCCFIQVDSNKLDIFANKNYWELIVKLSECFSRLHQQSPTFSQFDEGKRHPEHLKR